MSEEMLSLTKVSLEAYLLQVLRQRCSVVTSTYNYYMTHLSKKHADNH